MKIYAWLIENLYPLICKSRKKDISLLKALINIPTGFQKEETNVYKELIENNYSKEEIAYLNYLLLYYNIVPNSIKLGYSIVEEKIALNLCKVFINGEKSYSEEIYDFLDKLIIKYSKFNIKCYGYSGIKEALKQETNITNPTTFIKLYEKLDKNLHSFNILEDKWDIVASNFDSKKYEELFDNFLLLSGYGKNKINECINKYNKLTEKEYLESFLKQNYRRDSIFSFLINNEILILKDFFNTVTRENKKEYNYHLKEYIKGIRNKQSFELLKYLLNLNKYSIEEINDFGFQFEDLYRNYGYWSQELDIKREFLSIDEEIILFNSLENCIFYTRPERYNNFLENVLKSNVIEGIIQQKELKKLYDLFCEMNPKAREDTLLMEKYLTDKEREEIYEQKKKQKELQKQKELIEIKEELTKEFVTVPKENFKELYEFCDKFYYSSSKGKSCVKIVKEYIIKNIAKFNKNMEEIKYLVKIFNCFIYQNEITIEEFKSIIFEYLEKEAN